MMPDTQQARWQNDPWKQNEDFADAKESTQGDSGSGAGMGAATAAITAANPIAGAAMMAGSMLLDNIMKAKAQRQQMQLAHYQNQLSSITGGVNQYAQGTRTVNQDMLQAMRGLA